MGYDMAQSVQEEILEMIDREAGDPNLTLTLTLTGPRTARQVAWGVCS